jgi:hypothetical protein
VVGAEYPAPEWHRLLIYLTPDGAAPTLTDYLPADYDLVADAVEAVRDARGLKMEIVY